MKLKCYNYFKTDRNGDCMNHNIIGALIAAAIGLLIAFVNYLISKKVLINAPEKYSLVTVARQILQIGFLAASYFIGTNLKLADPVYLLVGAVLGMTLPMLFFTKKLLAVNESALRKKKEDETDG